MALSGSVVASFKPFKSSTSVCCVPHSVGHDGAQAIARVEGVNGLQRPLDTLELVRDVVIQLEPALHATKTLA